MNLKPAFYAFAFCSLLLGTCLSQANPSPALGHASPQYSTQGSIASAASPAQGAVSYASVTQLNTLLGQLETTSKSAQADLSKLRIEHWKTDGSSKKQALGNVDSIQRNLQNAMPEMIAQLRNSPEDMPATFKLYRNLDALYDVMGGLAESAGAFGPKDDFQALSGDLNSFENARRQLAERLETLAGSKEQEIARLRTELKTAQAAIPAAPPKKIIVDDNEPPKKPGAKRKPAAKKPATPTPPATTPAQTPPAQPKQQ
jgi:hypothetical protein